jgi:tetratricopeptide (TPR) repeat protein
MAVAATLLVDQKPRISGAFRSPESRFRNLAAHSGRTSGQVRPEAMAHYKQTLDMEPDTARAHINLGNTLRAGGKLDEAVTHYLKALDIEPRNAGAHINLGNILRVGGRFDEAEAHYLKALEIEPDNAGTHINLGGILCVRGRLDEATAHFMRALAIEPQNAGAHLNVGNVFQAQGKLAEATAHYEAALGIKPGNAGAHFNLGNLLQAQGKLDDSMTHYRKALNIEPDHAAAHINLGNLLQAQGKFYDAIEHYRKALPRDPGNAALYNNLGGAILGAHGDLNDAAACFERALALEPHYAEAHFNLGNVFRDQGKLDEALSCFERALALMPDRPDFHNQLGNALRDQGKLEPAAECCKRALALDPNYAEAHYNLGNVFGDQGKLDDALGCYERALTLKPDYADAYTNLIITLRDQGRIDDAMACCKRALSFRPDSADAHFSDAYFRLLTGDFVEGWRKYEWRWLIKDAKPHGLTLPLWDGKDLRGRTILLHCEQGLGDSIQCVRFARLVKEKGGAVLLACPALLAGLFKDVAGIDRSFPDGRNLPGYDVHAPLMSLPGLFETTLDTIPADVPYLQSDPARVGAWRNRLASYHGFRVGIAWRGRPTHPDDRRRSMTAAQFTEFLNIPGLAVVSLQQDGTAGEVETLGNIPGSFFNAGPFLEDFSDTASVMANLDLVIAVDTSVCHLAGALAAPVWTLIPFVPDWRWLLQREDSPWYPAMRLFRQPKAGDWQSVLERVREELAILTERKRRGLK